MSAEVTDTLVHNWRHNFTSVLLLNAEQTSQKHLSLTTAHHFNREIQSETKIEYPHNTFYDNYISREA